MKLLLRLLKWTFFLVLGLVATVVLVAAFRQDMRYEAPLPNIKASKDSTIIARGRQLVYSGAHCTGCHGAPNADSLLAAGIEPPLLGGKEWKLPVATLRAPNITSDSATGIGGMSDGQIARSLYYGVDRNNRAMFDFMPFHNVSQSDMQAIISFLRTQPPVHNPVAANKYTPLGRLVKAFFIKPVGPSGPIVAHMAPDTTVAYGAYLVHNVANCAGCHTQRNLMTGAFAGPILAGGMKMEEEGMPTFITPNLTPHASSHIAGWSEAQFVQRMQSGRRIQHSPMPWESYARLSPLEVKAIYRYLQTVPAEPLPVEP